MANTPRKVANVNTNNARGNVVPGAQHVQPAKKVAATPGSTTGPSQSGAYARKSTNLSASNLPWATGDRDAQKNSPASGTHTMSDRKKMQGV